MQASVVQSVKRWVEEVVIEWNLCPFARREFVNNKIRFQMTEAETEEALLLALAQEVELLDRHPEYETTLLIHPKVLGDFLDYNDFLDLADGLLVQLEREGVYQIASFHPDYQFHNTQPEDPENYTNRAPYPLLHLLREQSMAEAIDSYPDVTGIPRRNIELMRTHGSESLSRIFRQFQE